MKPAVLIAAAVFVAGLASTAPTEADALSIETTKQPTTTTTTTAAPDPPQPSLAPALRPRRAEMAAMAAIAKATPTAMQQWVDGFLESGGPKDLVDIFTRQGGIIDAESDYRWDVVSTTGDYGAAQINQIHRHWVMDMIGHDGWREAL